MSGHKTGLPDKLLKLFAARQLSKMPPLPQRKPPKQRMGGMAQYVSEFAGPGDAEFNPPPVNSGLRMPRIFRNVEFEQQARIDKETKPEK